MFKKFLCSAAVVGAMLSASGAPAKADAVVITVYMWVGGDTPTVVLPDRGGGSLQPLALSRVLR